MKQLRTTKEITSDAIAKMKAMRQHAHAFAEGMLEHIAADEEIGKTTAWTAFSGLLDDAKIKGADWVRKEKQMSASSEAVYNTDQFNTFTRSPPPGR